MKVITKDDLTLYVLENTDTITDTGTMLEIRGTRDFNVSDLSDNNYTLYTDVTDVPEDWQGHRYFYNGTWTVNEDWVDPATFTLDY